MADLEPVDVVLTDALADIEADVVLDPVGGSARAVAFQALRPFGRHVIVGNASGDDLPFSGDALWMNTAAILGLNVGGITHSQPERASPAPPVRHSPAAQPGTVAVPALEDAAEAHRGLADRPAPNKIIIDIAR